MTKIPEYHARPHLVTAQTTLSYPQLREENIVIKPYTLLAQGERDFEVSELMQMNTVIRNAVDDLALSGVIGPNWGAGFSIMSEGAINVGVWGGKFPSLLNQRVYSIARPNIAATAGLTELEQEGTFCCWEGAIVGFESEACRRYLLSARTAEDRQRYLDARFSGLLQ